MILSLHPTRADLSGEVLPVPKDWTRFLVPWIKGVYRIHSFGTSLIQEMISRYFSIYIWTLDIKERVCLYSASGGPMIAMQFMLLGNIDCVLPGFGEKLLRQGNYEMFYLPQGYNEACLAPGLYETLHFELQLAYLEELIAIRPEIRDLIMRLLNKSMMAKPMGKAHMNYRTLTILQNLRTCKMEGASLQLELHKFILELLSEYFRDLREHEEERTKKDILHKDKMIEIRAHILTGPNIHKHTLVKLSRLFAISESVLKRSFKNFYNMNLSDFVHDQIMKRGYYLLTTTNKTIDEIAEELGYDWKASFEHAFKKHFQYSAASIRKA